MSSYETPLKIVTESNPFGLNQNDSEEEQALHNPESVPSENRSKLHIRRMYVFMLIIFLNNLGSSIVIPSLWYFLLQTNNHVETYWLGITLSCFVLGQTISLPVWSFFNERRNIKEVLLTSIILTISADVFFAFSNKYWLIPISRFISGLGSGSNVMIQKHLSLITSPQERIRRMGQLTLLSFISVTLGPLIGAILSFICISFTTKNNWTGFVSAGFGVLNAIIVLVLVKRSDKPEDVGATEIQPFASYQDQFNRQIKPIFNVVVALTVIYFLIFNGGAIYETTTPILAEQLVAQSRNITNVANEFLGLFDIFWAFCGFASTCSFLFLTLFLIRFMNEIWMMFFFLSIILFAFIFSTILSFFESNITLDLIQYLVSVPLLAFGFPGAMTVSIAFYSKVLGSAPQGLSLSLLSYGAIIARLIGPIWSSLLCASNVHNIVLFSVSTALMSLALITLIAIMPTAKRVMWPTEALSTRSISRSSNFVS
eukprot:TRINITY_DN14976_c0_g1_i1.p1 TRINITY_DN14976_c0_g1~~TRINITY_DN14976_c0_g1_i1.p1  ORF type:complete len:484 (+),score=41.53 TRINITY_DN14976_c0_g1_i1:62-1513(+)